MTAVQSNDAENAKDNIILLHRDSQSNNFESKVSSMSSPTSNPQPSTTIVPAALSHLAAATHERQQVLLATAVVTLITDHGHSIKVRALLDQGSKISLIQESLVQLLHLSRSRASIPIMSIGAQHAGSTRGSVILRVQSRFDASSDFSVTAHCPRLPVEFPQNQ